MVEIKKELAQESKAINYKKEIRRLENKILEIKNTIKNCQNKTKIYKKDKKKIQKQIKENKENQTKIEKRLEEKIKKYENSAFPKIYKFLRTNKIKKLKKRSEVLKTQLKELEKKEKKLKKQKEENLQNFTKGETELEKLKENLAKTKIKQKAFEDFTYQYEDKLISLEFTGELSLLIKKANGAKILKAKLEKLKNKITQEHKKYEEITLTINNESIEKIPDSIFEVFPDIKFIEIKNCKFKNLNNVKKLKQLDGIDINENLHSCDISFYNNKSHNNCITLNYENKNFENQLSIKEYPGVLIKNVTKYTRIYKQRAIAKEFITCSNDKSDKITYLEFNHNELSSFIKKEGEAKLKIKLNKIVENINQKDQKVNLVFTNESLKEIPDCIFDILPNIDFILIKNCKFKNLNNIEKLKKLDTIKIFDNKNPCEISFYNNKNLINFYYKGTKPVDIKQEPYVLMEEIIIEKEKKDEKKEKREKIISQKMKKENSNNSFFEDIKELIKLIHNFIKKVIEPIKLFVKKIVAKATLILFKRKKLKEVSKSKDIILKKESEKRLEKVRKMMAESEKRKRNRKKGREIYNN